MLSEVVTCNWVRNPGGHAEPNPRPSEEGSAFITSSDHWRIWLTTVPDHAAFRSVPSAVETSGYMGKQAAKFVNCLGEIAAESGSIAKGAYVRWAMQLLSVTVQRGNAEMYRRSGLIISREQGLCYDAGFAVPVLMS